MLRSPIRYFGGKGKAVQYLLPLIPPHHTYVEPFGSGASLLMAKRPSPVEVYNDVDSDLVNMFRVIRDKETFPVFQRQVSLIPYAREEWRYAAETLNDDPDPIMRAVKYFVVMRQGFAGVHGAAWGMAITTSSRGIADTVNSYLGAIAQLPEIRDRLIKVQIEHADYRKVLRQYDTPNTLFYCDPPYVPDTRKSGGYKHEMTADDHEALVTYMLTELQGSVMISGYANPIYQPLETAGWERIDRQTSCYGAARTRASGILGDGAATEKVPRIETVWLNYPPPGTSGKLF